MTVKKILCHVRRVIRDVLVPYAIGILSEREKAYLNKDEKTLKRLASEQRDAKAQNLLGVMYKNGYGVEKDYREAVKWWTLAAQQGDADAQYTLGWMYANGFGVETDDREAHKWLNLAVAQGDETARIVRDMVAQQMTPDQIAEAQYHLGLMYHDGEGVKKDYRLAVEWWTLAAQQGDADAQYNLGVMYHDGEGVKKDYREAVKWWTKAAQQEHPTAQFLLGVMYYYGDGVETDYREAVKWLTLAAQQGDADAQYNLGVMYHDGEGVKKDYRDTSNGGQKPHNKAMPKHSTTLA